jgi:lipopolysaccharide transport system permease protein
MVGVIEMFRWSLFGGAPPNQFLVAAVVVTVVVLVTGLFYFRRMERTFADVV